MENPENFRLHTCETCPVLIPLSEQRCARCSNYRPLKAPGSNLRKAPRPYKSRQRRRK